MDEVLLSGDILSHVFGLQTGYGSRIFHSYAYMYAVCVLHL